MKYNAMLESDVSVRPGTHMVLYGRAWVVMECLNNISLYGAPKRRFRLVLVSKS